MKIQVQYEDVEYEALWWISSIDNTFLAIFDWQVI